MKLKMIKMDILLDTSFLRQDHITKAKHGEANTSELK